MMKSARVVAIAVVASVSIGLAGCSSPAPSRDELAERFVIELEGAAGSKGSGTFDEVADLLARDALDGLCADGPYTAGLVKFGQTIEYAWASTCLMYFEDSMSPTQVKAAKWAISAEVARRAG